MSCEQARKAVTEAYNLQEVDECIAKLVRQDHRGDFKQELFLILLEIPCEKITAISDKGELRYYTVRIILNLVRQKRNVYHTKYLDNKVVYETGIVPDPAEEDCFDERNVREQKELQLMNEIDNLDKVTGTFYHRELVHLIAKLGGQRAVSRELGIPQMSISDSVRKVREHLKKI